MSDEAKELLILIDKMVEEKTLNLDAIESVKSLKDSVNGLERTLTQTVDDRDECRTKLTKKEIEITQMRAELSQWKAREKNLVEREDERHVADMSAAIANAKAETAIDMFRTVFKNTGIRREMFGSQSHSDGQGFTTSQPVNETETIEKT